MTKIPEQQYQSVQRTFLLMRFLIKAKCPQSICILVLILSEDFMNINLIRLYHIWWSMLDPWTLKSVGSRKTTKKDLRQIKKYFKFMGYKMRLRWNTEASCFGCWMEALCVYACSWSRTVCSHMYLRPYSVSKHQFYDFLMSP